MVFFSCERKKEKNILIFTIFLSRATVYTHTILRRKTTQKRIRILKKTERYDMILFWVGKIVSTSEIKRRMNLLSNHLIKNGQYFSQTTTSTNLSERAKFVAFAKYLFRCNNNSLAIDLMRQLVMLKKNSDNRSTINTKSKTNLLVFPDFLIVWIRTLCYFLDSVYLKLTNIDLDAKAR